MARRIKDPHARRLLIPVRVNDKMNDRIESFLPNRHKYYHNQPQSKSDFIRDAIAFYCDYLEKATSLPGFSQ